MWQLDAPESAIFGLPDKAQTTAIASYGADLQRGQGVQEWRARVRSVATHKVRVVVGQKLSIHAVLLAVVSGQLPHLGLSNDLPLSAPVNFFEY
jgi:hypothetical protein